MVLERPRCRLFHDWGKWSDAQTGNITNTKMLEPVTIIGRYIEQRRDCRRCGKAQLRIRKATID